MPGIEKAVWLLTATRLSLCIRYSDVDSLRLGIQQGKDNFIYDVGVPPLSGEFVFETNKCVEDHTVCVPFINSAAAFTLRKKIKFIRLGQTVSNRAKAIISEKAGRSIHFLCRGDLLRVAT